MFKHISIRHKLSILLFASAAFALFISSILIFVQTYSTEQKESLTTLRQLCDVSSENIKASLAFKDEASAQKMLSSLSNVKNIALAVVFDEEKRAFATYKSNMHPTFFVDAHLNDLKSILLSKTIDIGALQQSSFDYMVVFKPIVFEGKTIGTLCIVSDNERFKQKMQNYAIIQSIVSFVSLALIVLLSLWLQRFFTHPILKLIEAMQIVGETKNYSYNAMIEQKDEFADLYHYFNLMMQEISQRDAKLSQLATTDALTGLSNRRHALELFETAALKAARQNEPIGVIMMDIDFFKKVNDTYGHSVGDLVLKEVSKIVKKCAREYDIVARLGGEEFLIICENSDISQTIEIAQRIRQNIQDQIIVYDGDKSLKVTASFGCYAAVPNAHQESQMISIADEALYVAKNSGRNRVESIQQHTEEK
ncbi:MAG: diguanylate cyclase [Campylobacteraceae bacterium]|jgi:diguanylate cyclase (GGDEF)-like protein|nr:diguanylate cyclase [Campylobacteraceae bacterium]